MEINDKSPAIRLVLEITKGSMKSQSVIVILSIIPPTVLRISLHTKKKLSVKISLVNVNRSAEKC